MKCETCGGLGDITCHHCEGTGEAITVQELLDGFNDAETMEEWQAAFSFMQRHISHVCPNVRDLRRVDIVRAMKASRKRVGP